MASIAAISALVLICIVKVQGFVGDGTPSIDGIYPGRFGKDNIKISAQAVFSMGGVTGTVTFSQPQPGEPVEIHVNLNGLDQFTDEYPWTVHNYPVRSSILNDFPCSNDNLGGVFYDVANTNGPLNYEEPWQTFSDSTISLSGYDSIIGRSLVIDRQFGNGGDFICANIEQLGARLEILRAPFDNGIIQGEVVFRYAIGRADVTIEADIYKVDGVDSGNEDHTWSLHYGTSVNNSCDDVTLESIFGSSTFTGDDHGPKFNCGPGDRQRECRIGDLTSKCGPLTFQSNQIHTFCTDSQIGSIPRSYLYDDVYPPHGLVLAIRDSNGVPLGCAPLEMVAPLTGRAQFRGIYGFGDFYFWQTGPDDRTYIRAHITGLDLRNNYTLRIYENVIMMNEECTFAALGNVISRMSGEFLLPGDVPSGSLGNLEALIPLRQVTSYRDTVTTSSLPLFGHNTILGNTIALVREDTNQIIGCSTIYRQEEYPRSELGSLQGYQNQNDPPIPPIPRY